jgi:predicted Kef-type K+ transport protein
MYLFQFIDTILFFLVSMSCKLWISLYLAIIFEVCFQYILNICWVCSINLTPKKAEQSVGLVLPSKISHIVLQPMEIQKLVKYGATNSMKLLLLPMLLLRFPKEDKSKEKSYD